jgi:hypothetical protein
MLDVGISDGHGDRCSLMFETLKPPRNIGNIALKTVSEADECSWIDSPVAHSWLGGLALFSGTVCSLVVGVWTQ